jgi:two-component system chemotaxis response regulator CheV
VTVCTDGQQAWDIIQENRDGGGRQFDLVLSDIEMPRMDGLHLTSRIKNDPILKEIPVVLFSSLITADNIRKGHSVGADAQVSKPDSQEMIKAIETCLAGKCVTA